MDQELFTVSVKRMGGGLVVTVDEAAAELVVALVSSGYDVTVNGRDVILIDGIDFMFPVYADTRRELVDAHREYALMWA